MTVMKLLPFIEAIGIIAFCISGFIRARQRQFDAVGVFVVGFATAFGGLHSTATFNLMLSNSDSTLWVRSSYQMLQKKSLGPTKPDFCTKTQLFGPTKCFD